MDNQFENKGKDQNVAQGEGAIGKQINNYDIFPEVFARYAGDLAVTDSTLNSIGQLYAARNVL